MRRYSVILISVIFEVIIHFIGKTLFVYFRASTESLDFSSKYNTLTPSLGSGGSSSRSTTAPEPNIDFELDVKVFIDSGKCVLHPKDTKEEDATKKWVVQ